ncbi:MAG: O-antigen ligase family protein [Candidatus Binatia bacterium]
MNSHDHRARPPSRLKGARHHTTLVERCLLMVTVAFLPLEDHLPTIAGFSALFLLFGVVASYILVRRVRALYTVLIHPVFLATYGLLFVSLLNEFVHLNPNYRDLFRIGLMVAGAGLVASLCRDLAALRVGIYAYIAAGVCLSMLLFLTSYQPLQGARAASFQEASRARTQVVDEIPLQLNANKMALYTALGTVAAAALALSTRSLLRRALFVGITLFSLVATFLPMSRGGIVTAAIACAVVVMTYRTARLRTLVVTGLLGIGVLSWVPEVVFSRLELSAGSRANVFAAAVDSISEYAVMGVGAGNYWASWGYNNGFAPHGGNVVGAHNVFLQVAIYWGFASLLSLLIVIWQAWRCLPRRCGDDEAALCLKGIAVAVLVSMLFVHTLYDKHFSLALGLLVSAQRWIWPGRRIPVAENLRRRVLPGFVPATEFSTR